LLVKDLYLIDGEQSALSLFSYLRAQLPPMEDEGALQRCERLLTGIQAMEPRVRDFDGEAIQAVCEMALKVESELQRLAGKDRGESS